MIDAVGALKQSVASSSIFANRTRKSSVTGASLQQPALLKPSPRTSTPFAAGLGAETRQRHAMWEKSHRLGFAALARDTSRVDNDSIVRASTLIQRINQDHDGGELEEKGGARRLERETEVEDGGSERSRGVILERFREGREGEGKVGFEHSAVPHTESLVQGYSSASDE